MPKIDLDVNNLPPDVEELMQRLGGPKATAIRERMKKIIDDINSGTPLDHVLGGSANESIMKLAISAIGTSINPAERIYSEVMSDAANLLATAARFKLVDELIDTIDDLMSKPDANPLTVLTKFVTHIQVTMARETPVMENMAAKLSEKVVLGITDEMEKRNNAMKDVWRTPSEASGNA